MSVQPQLQAGEPQNVPQRPSSVIHSLCESEIGDFDIAGEIKQKILRFQISVNDVLWMKILYGEYDLSRIEPGGIVGKSTSFSQMRK